MQTRKTGAILLLLVKMCVLVDYRGPKALYGEWYLKSIIVLTGIYYVLLCRSQLIEQRSQTLIYETKKPLKCLHISEAHFYTTVVDPEQQHGQIRPKPAARP